MNEEYVYVKQRGHHRANLDGYVYEHVLVAEKMLGRMLKSEEVVHHKNKSKKDNSESNLMVFRSKADHAAYHKGKPAFLENDVYSCEIDNVCECGETKFNNAGYCRKCYYKRISASQPSRDELLCDILSLPMVRIGKKYGVTDNAIRKWCKKHGLPYKSKDIAVYRQELVNGAMV